MSGMTFTPAKRENVPLMIGLAGGTGSGKTFSAMRLAKGLAAGKRFALIDTESRRGLHYADRFAFDHAELAAPFRPAKYLEAILAAERAGYPVAVVDSTSHVWDGPGGCLEWHDELMGGKEAKKMTAWILPKTEHRKMVNALTQLRMHVVLCFRAQPKVEMVKVDGKWEIIPKRSLTGLDGWIPICEKNLPFELTMSLLLMAESPGVPRPIKIEEQHRPFVPLDSPLTDETGVALAQWAAGESRMGAPDAALEVEITALIEELLTFADAGAKREQVLGAIARNRREHSGELGAHVAWLGAQLERARQRTAAKPKDEDLEL